MECTSTLESNQLAKTTLMQVQQKHLSAKMALLKFDCSLLELGVELGFELGVVEQNCLYYPLNF